MTQPHSLSTVSISATKTIAQLKAEAGWAARHGYIPGRMMPWKKGDKLPETRVLACPRVKVADLPEDFLPKKYFEALEHNQQIASCCRHPENHFIEAHKSHPDEKAPDSYTFICDSCGKKHRRFCVGQSDVRPVWDAA